MKKQVAVSDEQLAVNKFLSDHNPHCEAYWRDTEPCDCGRDETEEMISALRAQLAQAEAVAELCEEHRKKYNDPSDYWRGRRDEAGWIRDQLKAALESTK